MKGDLNEIIAHNIAKVNSRGRDNVPFRQRSIRQQDARITNDNVRLQVRRDAISGEEIPSEKVPLYKLPVKVRKALETSRISDNDYIILQEYARFLPRGKRELLRLDLPALKKILLGNVLAKDSLTNDSGLRQGGKIADMVVERKPKEEIIKTLLTQREHHTIFNGSTVVNPHNYTRGLAERNQNPNPTSFKNHFVLKSKNTYPNYLAYSY